MKKLMLFLLALGGCAQSKHSPNGDESRIIRVRVVTEKTDKEVSYQLDTTRVADAQTGNLTKIADGIFSGQITLATMEDHDLQLFSETADITPDAEVTVDEFRVCANDKGMIYFPHAVTADQICRDALVEKIKIGKHISAQETMIPLLNNENSIQQILDSGMPLMIHDYECLGQSDCAAKMEKFHEKKILNIIYVNPRECMVGVEIEDRPFQKKLCETARALYPKWLMIKKDGQPMISWHNPEMQSLNLSTVCPQYKVGDDDKVWSEFLIDYILEIIRQHPGLVDGILLDNGDAYFSWQDGIELFDQNGNSLNNWEIDLAWRAGYQHMLKYARKKLGRKFLIGTVGNSPFFGGADMADFIVYEAPFNQKLGAQTQEAHPHSVVHRLFELSKAYRFVIVEHCEGNCTEPWYPAENHLETGYAFTQLIPNSLYIFDQLGPASHGNFESSPIYRKSGPKVGETELPFKSLDKREEVSLKAGDNSLNPKVKKGYFAKWNYSLVDAIFHQSTMAFPGSDPAPTDWVDGPVYTFINDDGEFPITMVGSGILEILGFELFGYPDGMYCSTYRNKKLCFNADESQGYEMSFRGKTVMVPPLQGRQL